MIIFFADFFNSTFLQVASILLPKELSDQNETSCKYDLRKCPAGQLEKWESKFLNFFDTQSHASKFIIWSSSYALIFVTFLFFPVLYHAPFILYVPTSMSINSCALVTRKPFRGPLQKLGPTNLFLSVSAHRREKD